MSQVKIGDTARLREGDLVRLGTIEKVHGEYAYVILNGDSLITSARLGTFETVDTRDEGAAAVSALRKLARSLHSGE